jgi:hypothetical protein
LVIIFIALITYRVKVCKNLGANLGIEQVLVILFMANSLVAEVLKSVSKI